MTALLAMCAVCAWLLCVVAQAGAAPTLRWTGEAARSSLDWSDAANWEGAAIPSGTADLEFPHLTRSDCAEEPPLEACYESENDISGLTVESMRVDDAGFYEIYGSQPITIGSGGITSEPEGTKLGFAELAAPVSLAASQTWKLAGTSREALEHNIFFLENEVIGDSSALTIDVSKSIGFFIGADVQVGALSIDGAEATGEQIKNAIVAVGEGGALNSLDGEPVNLAHVYFFGSGQLGALHTEAATLAVGSGQSQAGELGATSIALDSNTAVEFEEHGISPTPGVDYAELRSSGRVELGSALLLMFVSKLEGQACQAPPIGRTYTLVATTGELVGSFGNAPEGTQIPVTYLKECGAQPVESLQIEYHRSGATRTVTGRVMAGSTSTTALQASSTSSVTNQEVKLTATVQSSGETPGGSVEFMADGNTIAACSNKPVLFEGSSYTAVCHTSFPASGSPEHLSAVFTPGVGVDLEASSSGVEDLTVGQGSTTTAVHASSSAPSTGQAVTYTATVTPSYDGASVPSGSVQFTEGGAQVGSCSNRQLQPNGSDAVATCVLSYPAAGEHLVIASYSGDTDFTPSSGGQAVSVVAPEKSPVSSEMPPASSILRPSEETVIDQVKPSRVTLDTTSIPVRAHTTAIAKLTCDGSVGCGGKLTLSVRQLVKQKGHKKVSRTVVIGTAMFTISSGKTFKISVHLTSAGRGLLASAHGHMAARLQITQPSSAAPLSKEVRLLE